MYRWWVFLHILAVFVFLLAHGVSVSVALALRGEREPERIRTLLGLSSPAVAVAGFSLLAVIATGTVVGFLGHWWGRAWIWVSLGVLIALWVAMSVLGTRFYDRVRLAVEADPLYGAKKMKERPPPASPQELEVLLSTSRPFLLAAMGVIGLGVILWLMVLKPF
jgi:hypothetical protein